MIYIASPYSHSDADIRQLRYEQVKAFTAKQIAETRLPLFSPITYCHELAIAHALPLDAKFWYDFNFSFLHPAKALWVLCLDHWTESVGVIAEIDLAKELKIPVTYFDKNGRRPITVNVE